MPGVMVSVDQRQVQHVNNILRAVPEKALSVYQRAFARGLDAARVQAAKEIRERYDITAANLRTHQTIRQRVQADSSGVVGYISFAGAKIPLYRYHPSPKDRKYTTRFVNEIAGWRVTTEVSAADTREGGMVRRRTAFIATMPSGHTGIFTRTGEKTKNGKDRLRELYGFSVDKMLDYEPAREAIQRRAEEIVALRIDHELLRALDEEK